MKQKLIKWMFTAKAKRVYKDLLFGQLLEDGTRHPAMYNILSGAVRAGKTILTLLVFIDFIKYGAPGDLLIVGKTERTIQRNILSTIRFIVGRRNFKYNSSSGECWIYGRLIYIASANDESSSDKIQGMSLVGCLGDELTLWPESFWEMLTTRLSDEGARFFGATNPGPPRHFLMRDFISKALRHQDNAVILQGEGGDKDIYVAHFVLEDNPALPDNYAAFLKRLYQKGSLFYKRFILGLWVMAEGAVYDFFDEDQHVISEVKFKPDRYDVAIDYGTQNPFSAGLYGSRKTSNMTDLKAVRLAGYWWHGKAEAKQKSHIEYAREVIAFVAEKLSQLTFKEVVRELEKPIDRRDERIIFQTREALHLLSSFIVDPSEPAFILQLRTTLNEIFPTTELARYMPVVRRANNEVMEGIATVTRMLKGGQYAILKDKSNEQHITEFGLYVWDEAAQNKGEDKPVKANDHTLDENRYYLHTVHKLNQNGSRKIGGTR